MQLTRRFVGNVETFLFFWYLFPSGEKPHLRQKRQGKQNEHYKHQRRKEKPSGTN
jgi:hypothetical protein